MTIDSVKRSSSRRSGPVAPAAARHAVLGLCAAAALAWAPRPAAAAGSGDPVAFSHKDWELACDNTRTCRAAGYQAEDGTSDPVSIRLTRKAGPATAVEVDLQIGGEVAVRGPYRLQAGSADITGIVSRQGGTAPLGATQARALLPELLRADRAVVTASGSKRWVVSLGGLNAVLLKMDEAQDRIGTPGALVRRGGKPESSVPPSLPMPVVQAVRPVAARPGDAALAARIFPALDLRKAKETCNQAQPLDASAVSIDRLTETRVLVSLHCAVGAYNDMSLLWIANDQAPYAPRASAASGDFDPKDGGVGSFHKGRGIADCGSTEAAQFDGKDFVRTEATADTLCRGFAGGAWGLQRYVSRVVAAPR